MKYFIFFVTLCYYFSIGCSENFLKRKITQDQALKIIEILTESLHLKDDYYPEKDRRKAEASFESVADDYEEEQTGSTEKDTTDEKPCAITVLANYHDREMPTLIRRYRYNANGILIPNSVKYFMKVSLDGKGPPVLVPFNHRSYSPTGGFVSYYKQVPPIPHSL